jgi:hypothetical protein
VHSIISLAVILYLRSIETLLDLRSRGVIASFYAAHVNSGSHWGRYRLFRSIRRSEDVGVVALDVANVLATIHDIPLMDILRTFKVLACIGSLVCYEAWVWSSHCISSHLLTWRRLVSCVVKAFQLLVG